jgi:3-oxoacyl-[acyl-carrier-protein] synthase-1
VAHHDKLYLVDSHLITPVGDTALVTAAAVRAGYSAYADTEYANRDYQPMRMARVPEEALPPLKDELWRTNGLSARQRRLLQLMTPVLANAMASLSGREPPALMLAAPETLPGCPAAVPPTFLDYLSLQTGVDLPRGNCRILATGRAGGLQAVELAFRYVEQAENDLVLIGGVDSYQDHYLLEKLDKEDRILARGIKDGFAPGEAAGVLLLATERGADQLGRTPLATLSRPGLASEPGHRYSAEPYRGEGLSEAIRLALGHHNGGSPIHTVYSSMNGESFWVKEHGVAMTRHHGALAANLVHAHPADCFGDLGAASGPAMIGIAAIEGQQGRRNGPALVYCASDQAPRAAVCVQ